jgi:hypothetical protein
MRTGTKRSRRSPGTRSPVHESSRAPRWATGRPHARPSSPKSLHGRRGIRGYSGLQAASSGKGSGGRKGDGIQALGRKDQRPRLVGGCLLFRVQIPPPRPICCFSPGNSARYKPTLLAGYQTVTKPPDGTRVPSRSVGPHPSRARSGWSHGSSCDPRGRGPAPSTCAIRAPSSAVGVAPWSSVRRP